MLEKRSLGLSDHLAAVSPWLVFFVATWLFGVAGLRVVALALCVSPNALVRMGT